MPKIISYACDKCGAITDLDDLCPITVYCFSPSKLDEPKILEMDLVCPECREQFAEVIKSWEVGSWIKIERP